MISSPESVQFDSVVARLIILLLTFSLASAELPQSVAGETEFWSLSQNPPMGWNSYNCFGWSVKESEVTANANFMADHLKAFGWEYVVVDFCWSFPGTGTQSNPDQGVNFTPHLAMDPYGRLLPAPDRFPSAASGNGFRALADMIHSRGLKFGIHIMRGIPRQAVAAKTPVLGTAFTAADVADKSSTCGWLNHMYGLNMNHPGAQTYLNSLFALYASWEVDYVKVDDLSAPYHLAEIEGYRKAMDNCGRPMVFSTSPGETPLEQGGHISTNANLWRISADFWDDWQALKSQFDRCRKWAPFSGPGHWPDADMLTIGRLSLRGPVGPPRASKFTDVEKRTLLTLWSIFRSPLMIGGNLIEMDSMTLSLITNQEVLAVNQHSTNSHELRRRNNLIVWVADVPDSRDKYIAAFNVGDATIDRSAAAFQSDLVTRLTSGQVVDVDVDITGAKKLYLVVDDGDDGFECDHVDWIEPRLVGPQVERRITSLRWSSATSGWGYPVIGKSVTGKSLVVNGKSFGDGIGTHSESIIEYQLPTGFTRFKARAGLDEGGVSKGYGATARFLVFTNTLPRRNDGETVSVEFHTLGLSGPCRIRDLWTHKDLGSFVNRFEPIIPPHGAVLVRITPGAGQ